MLFSSPVFLVYFLPVVLVVALSLRRTSWQNTFLLAASLFFYAWGELAYTLILLASIVFNYAFGLWVDRARGLPSERLVLCAAIAGNLLVLAAFKYANFAVDNINALLDLLGTSPIELDPVHLPIGISFFTFQAMTYVVDVYRGNAPAQQSIFRVGLYVALFPQLIAGPIVRYRSVAQQLVERHASVDDIAMGIRRFVTGLAKKVLIADQLSAVADQIFALPTSSLDPAVAWLGVTLFGLQVYFDFSGYSDMAIGLGRMFGFHFPENFNAPYTSRSLQEFWRRWHISLSSWFRDYVYVPLSARSRSAGWGYFSLFVVFFLCGLWHGANWNFVMWGLVHGGAIALERTSFGTWLTSAPRVVARVYTLFVVWVAFVFFRAGDLGHSFDYLASMFGASAPDSALAPLSMFLGLDVLVWLGVAIVFSGGWMPAARSRVQQKLGNASYSVVRIATLVVLFVASVSTLTAGTNSPFVYFRF
jgi:alginate O-acetyltransferase complex protein AlgI